MKGKAYLQVLAVLLTTGWRAATDLLTLNVGSARHFGPTFRAQHSTLWSLTRHKLRYARMAAVRFLGQLGGVANLKKTKFQASDFVATAISPNR